MDSDIEEQEEEPDRGESDPFTEGQAEDKEEERTPANQPGAGQREEAALELPYGHCARAAVAVQRIGPRARQTALTARAGTGTPAKHPTLT